MIDLDGDGVSDFQEAIDGSDPQDPGSGRFSISSPSYGLWNGFLGLLNIFELLNVGEERLDATVTVLDNSGGVGGTRVLPSRQQGEQIDLVLNNIEGFESDRYGLVRVDFEGALAGRLSNYRINEAGSSEIGYSIPLLAPRYGRTAVTSNTFQPSSNPSDQNLPVLNWFSLVNLAEREKSFTISIYDQSGEFLAEERLELPAGARVDLDGGHARVGPSAVLQYITTPDDAKAPYLSQMTRFGPDASGGHHFAFPLIGVAGNGREQHVFISNRNALPDHSVQNWVEVANTLESSVTTEISFYRADGQLAHREVVEFPPFSQRHFNASQYLSVGETGHASVRPSRRNSVIITSMFYVRDPSGSISSMYGSQGMEAIGSERTGSYNLFIGLQADGYLVNVTDQPISVALTVHTEVPYEATLLLKPREATVLELHNTAVYGTAQDTYGVYTLRTSEPGQIVAEMIRRKSGEFAFPTRVE